MHSYATGLGIFIGLIALFLIFLLLLPITKVIKKIPFKAMAVILLIVSIVLSIGIGYTVASKMGTNYVSGDYASHKCSVYECDNPSDYKFNLGINLTRYYCSEHHAEGVEQYNTYVASSKQNNKTNTEQGVKCKSCGKEYKKGSDNASSIARSGMCTNCYNNYKSMQKFLDEQPLN